MLGEWHAVRRRGSDTVTVVGLVCQETIGILGRAKVKMASCHRYPQVKQAMSLSSPRIVARTTSTGMTQVRADNAMALRTTYMYPCTWRFAATGRTSLAVPLAAQTLDPGHGSHTRASVFGIIPGG